MLVNVYDHLQHFICPRGDEWLNLVRLSEEWWNRNHCPKERFPLVLRKKLRKHSSGLKIFFSVARIIKVWPDIPDCLTCPFSFDIYHALGFPMASSPFFFRKVSLWNIRWNNEGCQIAKTSLWQGNKRQTQISDWCTKNNTRSAVALAFSVGDQIFKYSSS